jgi:MoaA/NifB/PqqE/SkfB family radical SAM enzyme
MIKKNDYWCPLPWVGLDIGLQGQLKPCCKSLPSSIQSESIKNYLNSEWLNSLKLNLNENIQDPRCNTCWKEESVGRLSMRQHFRKFLKKKNLEKKIDKIQFLHVTWDNTCNLKCRICDFKFSSLWASEILNNKPSFQNSLDTVNEYQKKINEFNFINFYEDNHDSFNIVEISNTGGEPFLSKKHLQFLKKLISLGLSQKIFLSYNSNGTVYPKELIEEIWPHYKKVNIHLSIDDTTSYFEYQRHPAKWSTILKNIEKFKEKKINITLIQTLSVFNVLQLLDYENFVKKTNLYWAHQILWQPTEFSIQNLPKKIKNYILEKYKNKEDHEIFKIVMSICNMKSNIDESTFKQNFLQKIEIIDKIRQESFAKTFPELYSLIQ